MKEIGYITDICKPYVEGVQKAKTLDELKAAINEWNELAPDAMKQVEAPEFDWNEFQAGIKQEKRGKYAGDAWAKKYGAVLLPVVIMEIGLVGQGFMVPDGVVFHRLLDFKAIFKDQDGFYHLNAAVLNREKA